MSTQRNSRIRFIIEVEVPPTATITDFIAAAELVRDHVTHPNAPRYPQTFEDHLAILAYFAGQECLDGPKAKLVAASGGLVDAPSGECWEHPAGGTPSCQRCYPLRRVA